MWRAGLAAGLALIAAGGAGAQPSPGTVGAGLAFYPAAANAAGLEGAATIRCQRTPQLSLTGCALVSETPAGQGFGQAALDLAAHGNGNPGLNVDDPRLREPFELTVQFRQHPPSVYPDLTNMPLVITQPDILTRPTGDDLEHAYPRAAMNAGVEGRVVLECTVTKLGRLTHCSADEETPAGMGFAAAAVRLAGKYRMSPQKLDDIPVDGARVRLPIHFAIARG